MGDVGDITVGGGSCLLHDAQDIAVAQAAAMAEPDDQIADVLLSGGGRASARRPLDS